MPINRPHNAGFSLVELLVSLATGLFLLAGVMGIFSATLSSQGSSLKATRLNQELRSALDLISRDLRRAGYWHMAVDAASPLGDLVLSSTHGSITAQTVDSMGNSVNGFTAFNNNGINGRGLLIISDYGIATISSSSNATEVNASVEENFTTTTIDEGSWMIANPFAKSESHGDTDLRISSDGTCVQFTYDRDNSSSSMADRVTVNGDERFGYRLHGGLLQMQTGSAAFDCDDDSTGTWTDITTDNLTIASLQFTPVDWTCINLSDSGSDCNPDSAGYVVPNDADILSWIRSVEIQIQGQLTNDSSVTRNLEETVRLRNERLVAYGYTDE